MIKFPAFLGDCFPSGGVLCRGSQVTEKRMNFHAVTLKQWKWGRQEQQQLVLATPSPPWASTPTASQLAWCLLKLVEKQDQVMACGLFGALAVLQSPGNSSETLTHIALEVTVTQMDSHYWKHVQLPYFLIPYFGGEVVGGFWATRRSQLLLLGLPALFLWIITDSWTKGQLLRVKPWISILIIIFIWLPCNGFFSDSWIELHLPLYCLCVLFCQVIN